MNGKLVNCSFNTVLINLIKIKNKTSLTPCFIQFMQRRKQTTRTQFVCENMIFINHPPAGRELQEQLSRLVLIKPRSGNQLVGQRKRRCMGSAVCGHTSLLDGICRIRRRTFLRSGFRYFPIRLAAAHVFRFNDRRRWCLSVRQVVFRGVCRV